MADVTATAKEVVSDVKSALKPPKNAAGWIALAVVLFLLAVVFVAVERRKPGFFSNLVNPVRRIPGLNRVVGIALWVAAGAAMAGILTSEHHAVASMLNDVPGAPLAPLAIPLAGIMRRNGVMPNYTPLSSPGSGTTFTLNANNANRKVTFIIDRIPTRKGNLHNYVQYLEITALVPITEGGASADQEVYPDQYKKILRAFELRSQNKLGTLWNAGNTSGARLGLIDGYIANGYEPPVVEAFVVKGDETTTAQPTLKMIKWVVPFALGVSSKPHHFAPHAALLNESVLDLHFAGTDVLSADNTGMEIGNMVISVMAFGEWEGEARLHTPVKWGLYEPQGQGLITRLKLLGMGGAEGLNGVRNTMGLVGLYAMTGDHDSVDTFSGLGGGFTVDELTQVQATFLGIPTLEYPNVPMDEFLKTVGSAPGAPFNPGSQNFEVADPKLGVFPYMRWAVDGSSGIQFAEIGGDQYSGNSLAQHAVLYPFRMPPRELELSKVEEITGTQEIMLNFADSKSETTFKIGSCEVGEWDEDFKKEALTLILGPQEAAKHAWAHKLTKKQRPDEDGNTHLSSDKTKYLPLVAVPVGK